MKNNVSFLLFVIGCFAIIGGLFSGLATLLSTSVDESMPWIDIIYNTSLGVVGGVLMFGFSEVINLLDKIARKVEYDNVRE